MNAQIINLNAVTAVILTGAKRREYCMKRVAVQSMWNAVKNPMPCSHVPVPEKILRFAQDDNLSIAEVKFPNRFLKSISG